MQYPLSNPNPIHILLADDDEDDRLFFEAAINPAKRVTRGIIILEICPRDKKEFYE